ncbi:DUF2026 family protein [Comamonas piscis]|uniref:DUF2026 family protein n=1 Tax=Comamonas piscis TaxID=1562974 RepID=A0A7G5EM52_9BURK|nr:DUF2026 family protein [Comamonas piscis]QMV75077.1 DUF2026 family protein [Comamonas piscis]WSO33561.1 DUF2026 family protein [Comamonas piscis]
MRPLLPLPDYQRIYEVVYSVLHATEVAVTHRACLLFATVGTLILRDTYHLPATLSAGCFAMMINEASADVAVYGNLNDVGQSDSDAFHAWVECDGWLIDFMAPIMGVAMREDGYTRAVPRQMLQKRLENAKESIGEIQHAGEFYLQHDRVLTETLLDFQPAGTFDLIELCKAWHRRPPKRLKDMMMGDSHGQPKPLILRAPSITGVW